MRGARKTGIECSAVGRDDDAGVQEKVRYIDGRIEDAARVVAQVQHESFEHAGALVLQLVNGAAELASRVVTELAYANVAERWASNSLCTLATRIIWRRMS